MVVYLLLLSFCSFTGYLMDKYSNRKNRNYQYLMYMTFIALFLVPAIRFDVGRDYMNTYVMTYKKVLENASNIRMDIALMFFYRIMAFFKANTQWIFIITSVIINLFVCKSIKNQSSYCLMSLWIYLCGMFYFFSMNGVRQSVAIALFYYSLRYIEEKNIKKFMIINGIGCLFHASALIFLPMYFILGRKYKLKTKIIFAVGVFLGSNILRALLAVILMRTKYAMYLTNGAYTTQESFNFSMILNIAIFFIYEWTLRRKSDDKSIIYSNIHYAGLIVSLFVTSLPLIIRVFVYFRFIEFLSVPNLIQIQERKKYRQIIIAGVLVLYFAYFIWAVFIKNGNEVLPYQTFFGQF